MPAYKNIALIGASGSIGSIILTGLIQSSQFNITVLSRKESKANFPAGVTVYKSDFSDTDLDAALKNQDAVISALGAGGFQEQKKIVDAAIRAGVKRFIPSEFSASSQTDAVLELLPFFAPKAELVEYLKGKEGDLSWTGIAAGLLFDWGLANGFLGFDIPNRTATVWDDGNTLFTLTNEATLTEAVVSVLLHPEETRNEYIYISSVETTQNEILRSLQAATADKWIVKSTSTEAQEEEAQKKLGAGDFAGAYVLVCATAFGKIPGLKANYVTEQKVANERLGLGGDSVDDTVRRVVEGRDGRAV